MPRINNPIGCSICLILIAAPFVFAPSLHDFANLPQSVFIQISVFLLIAVSCEKAASRGRLQVSLHPIHLLILSFLSWTGLSLFWSHNVYEGALQFIHLAACAAVFFLIAGAAREEKWLVRMLASILVAGVGASLVGCAQYLFHMDLIPQAFPPAGAFANRTVAAQFVSMTLPLHPVFFFYSSNKYSRGLSGVSVLPCVAFLVFSETRAGWLACLAAGAFMLIALVRNSGSGVSRPRISKKAAGAIIAFTLLIIAAAGFLHPGLLGSWLEISKNKLKHGVLEGAPPGGDSTVLYEDTMDLRLGIWRNSLEMVKDHPMAGVGVGNFKIFYPAYHQRVHKDRVFRETMQLRTCHNDFLQIAAELGATGALLFSGLLACFFFMVFAPLAPGAAPRARLIAIGAAGGVVAFLTHAMFSFPMERSIPPLLFFVYLAVVTVCYSRSASPVMVKTISIPPMFRAPTLIIIAGSFLLFAGFQTGALMADRCYLTALINEKRGNWPEVVRAGERGIDANPFRADILGAVGRARVASGRVDEGVEDLEKVLTAYPYSINAMVNLGVGYHKTAQTDRAIETFKRVLEIKPDSARALANLGKIHMKGGEEHKALDYFEKASAHDPRNPFLYINIGYLRYKEKKFMEAADAYEKALRLDP
ncbi:MAG: tetratricopeptide repeat protein, partial [Desulfobacterales bacterium]|nr:tetratricopeptide repeat protein [Desulfobacterales bacterium]